jgi:C-terminal processing protease CtpA/Prc
MRPLLAFTMLGACTAAPAPRTAPAPAPEGRIARADLDRALGGDLSRLGGALSLDAPRQAVDVRIWDAHGPLARAGLHDGDRVVAIAGLPPAASAAPTLLQLARHAPALEVTVRRGGQGRSWRVAVD